MSLLTFASVYVIIGIAPQGALGISIRPTKAAVEYCDADNNVTLPCLLSSYTGRMQIEWYYIHPNGSTHRVMRVNSAGEVMAGDNHKGRVRRGDSASLVLTHPRYSDAGSYRCEVLSTEDPCCPKAVVNLAAKETGCKCRECDAERMKIDPPFSEVQYCDTEGTATLPCIYDHVRIETLQIKWFLSHSYGLETVMDVNLNGEITEAQIFTGRVYRGGSASLILKNPRYNDSGVYGCEISILGDAACCTTGLVNLTIGDCPDGTFAGKDIAIPLIFFFLDTIAIIYCIAVTVRKCHTKKTPRPYIFPYFTDIRGLRLATINSLASLSCCLADVLLIVHVSRPHQDYGLLAAGVVFSLFGLGVAILFRMAMLLKQFTTKRRSAIYKSRTHDGKTLISVKDTDIDGSTECQKPADSGQAFPIGERVENIFKKQSDAFRLQCKEITQDKFVRTKPYTEAYEALMGTNSLLIVGGPGEGKSSILSNLVAVSDDKYLPIQCSKPGEVERYITENNTDEHFMFVFDNAFLHTNRQAEVVRQWVQLDEKLGMYRRSHKFIFATRHSLWADCKAYLGESQSFLAVVEVSSDKLTLNDKLRLLSMYRHDKLTDQEVEYIANIGKPIAYVQCCKLMNESTNQHLGVVDIFHRPVSFLCTELEKLAKEDKVKYDTLCLITLCGGKIPCRQLHGSISEVEKDLQEKILACDFSNEEFHRVLESAEQLLGVYLVKINEENMGSIQDVYQFTHDAEFEAVILVYSKRRMSDLVDYLDAKTAVEMFRPCNWEKHEKKCVIKIPVDCYRHVVRRFTSVCIQGDSESVFQNPLVKDERFQKSWKAYLESSNEQRNDLKECKGNKIKCSLYNAKCTGAKLLYKYLNDKMLGTNCKCKYSATV